MPLNGRTTDDIVNLLLMQRSAQLGFKLVLMRMWRLEKLLLCSSKLTSSSALGLTWCSNGVCEESATTSIVECRSDYTCACGKQLVVGIRRVAGDDY